MAHKIHRQTYFKRTNLGFKQTTRFLGEKSKKVLCTRFEKTNKVCHGGLIIAKLVKKDIILLYVYQELAEISASN